MPNTIEIVALDAEFAQLEKQCLSTNRIECFSIVNEARIQAFPLFRVLFDTSVEGKDMVTRLSLFDESKLVAGIRTICAPESDESL